ncbi:MAG TPA: cysteine desulfurase family protein [Archangium sp.]|jgi:cysteine desulfurase|uniref:cysteine desulfurase family protein n=1 Tax=Archangium sp. TaxID=1872627 RepID=UPI002EDB4C8E
MTEPGDPIYLDHNATTPLLPEVVDAMVPYLREHFGNPSSAHVYGRRAREAVDRARAQVAALLGARAEEIFFVAHGTEANNLAIRGVAAALPEKRHLVTSVIEHPATTEPCRELEKHGHAVTWLPVDEHGRVRVSEAVAALREDTALVTLMHANNETGVLQPIAAIAREARARGVLVHTDAAQSVGKLPVSVEEFGVDLLTLVGHKFGAPKGVGALYVRKGTPLRPVLLGAGHERGLRPGTENVASLVGLGVACEVARRTVEGEAKRVRALRDELWERLRARVPGLALNGHPEERLPNTLNVRFPGVSGSALLTATPEVAASTGSACHAGEESASSVLTAMGVEPRAALGSVRLSLGRTTTHEDVVAAAEALIQCVVSGWLEK